MKGAQRHRLSLSKMAETVNLSPTHLCYLFKSETGTPPARYLRRLRMQNAATLLAETFLSVKEVMARVGFSDESHFVRDFKRIHGLTPTEYRKGNHLGRKGSQLARNKKDQNQESNFRPTVNKNSQQN